MLEVTVMDFGAVGRELFQVFEERMGRRASTTLVYALYAFLLAFFVSGAWTYAGAPIFSLLKPLWSSQLVASVKSFAWLSAVHFPFHLSCCMSWQMLAERVYGGVAVVLAIILMDQTYRRVFRKPDRGFMLLFPGKYMLLHDMRNENEALKGALRRADPEALDAIERDLLQSYGGSNGKEEGGGESPAR